MFIQGGDDPYDPWGLNGGGGLGGGSDEPPGGVHGGPYSPPPAAPPPAPPHGGGNGGVAGAGFEMGSFPDYDFGPTPQFHAPRFVAPTADEVLNSPDYQSRLRSGTDALERSAAARGTLRTGGTLKDVIDYGKKFGQGEYDTSFNHSLQGYQANYRAAYDEFAPQLSSYQLRAQAALQRALAIYGRGTAWNDPHGSGGGGGGSGIPPFQQNPYEWIP